MNDFFLITNVRNVFLIDEKKYPNNRTEYLPNLIANEIIYRPNGYSTVNFDGKTIKTSPGSVYILPKKNGGKYTVDFEEPDIFIDIFFDTDVPVFDKPMLLSTKNNANLNSLFHKAFSCWVKKEKGYKFECISIINKIFAELLKENYIPDNKFKKIEPAINYIEKNFLNQNICCEKLTELCEINYSYLQRLFNEKFGLPPKKYIIQLKINYARQLLASGTYSVSRTAEECGFSNVYFFSRQFKEYTGLSPTEYIVKKRVRNK
ncbi:MAG: helix-turn-helix transcriptional regulator [Clostridia bacterium]|nr:helix-turn-helix transcriptional regulator [Clostridia bacterium]